jgi:hypothetical protein
MSKEQRYLVNLVREDLTYLKEKWDQEISDESLRRSSNVLRNLLVEDQLGRAWRIIGFEKQPVIRAPDLERYIDDLDISRIMLAQAGGAVYHGMEIVVFTAGKYALSPEQIRKRAQKNPDALKRQFYLKEYLDSLCMVIKGNRIYRRELIKYVANKLGGTHVDFRRNPSNETERKYIALDSIPHNLEVGEKRAIYLELLSIGQSIATAADTERFISVAKDLSIG